MAHVRRRLLEVVAVAVGIAASMPAASARAQSAQTTTGSAEGLGADFDQASARLRAMTAGETRKLQSMADCIRWVRTDDGRALRVLAIGVLSGEAASGGALPKQPSLLEDPLAIAVDATVVAVEGKRVGDIPPGDEHRLPFPKTLFGDAGSRLVTLRLRAGDREQDRILQCVPFDETLAARATARAKELERNAPAELRAALAGMTDDEADAAGAGLGQAMELLKARPKDGVGFGPRHRLEVPGQYTYEGQVRSGKPHGEGTISFPSAKLSCTGEFIDGELPRGRCTDDASTYEGELRQFRPHGKGVTRMKDGSRHEGLFAEGQFHGAGVYFAANGTRVEGTWTRGELSGDIVARYSDGWTYRGPFSKGNGASRPRGKYFDASGKLRGEAPFSLVHPT